VTAHVGAHGSVEHVQRDASGDRATSAVDTALQLVDAVRRWDRRDVRAALSDTDLPALCVVLAAMVNDDAPLSELLGWTEDHDDFDGWSWPDVLAAHAQYEACRSRGVEVPQDVRDGQRVYDRVLARQRRARTRAAA
jgi:hypothetical protein